MPKLWQIHPRTESTLLGQLLKNRGVAVEDHARFLVPAWERDTFAPSVFGNMTAAVERVLFALEKGEPIVIHGDYDADGVSGTSLLFTALREISEKLHFPFNVRAFLPDREQDGYGVAMHNVEKFALEGVKVLVTVDCGIANGLELGRAHELGIDTVVCDHHQMGQYYPEHAIVLHPLAPGETYPNKVLCGTGVAFKLASALIIEARKRGASFPEGHEKWLLDLVAVATVTDVMPLLGENRTLEHFGLKVLQKTRRPGLRALFAVSGTEPNTIDTQAIGFRIGPRLNAAGRLASASLAFDTLTAQTEGDAALKATELERLNKERQRIFAESYKEAELQVKKYLGKGMVLVVYSATWLPGIIGLIAGRLVNDFGVPAFAMTRVGNHIVGSGRSLGGLHLVEAMNACGDELYVKRGGHPQACGLTLKGEPEVDLFRDRVNLFAADYFGHEGPKDVLKIDMPVQPGEITMETLDELAQCAPFGEGNRSPVFAALGLRVTDVGVMGSTGTHLRLTVKDEDGGKYRFVGFGFGHLISTLKIGNTVDIAYEVGKNEWNGRVEVQYRMVDVRGK